MSKSSIAAAPKVPLSFPAKSAWAKGPPQNTSANSSPRSQSPAPSAQTPTHSRRPSALSSTYKDGVAMNPNAKPTGQATLKFGSVNDKLPLTSPPPEASSSSARPEPRKAPVQTFGSIEASSATSNGLITPPASIASGASTAASTPASTPAKAKLDAKLDVKLLFRGSGSTNASSSPVTPTSEAVSSPPIRTQTLSPQVHNLPLPPSGPAGPSPLSQAQQPPLGSQPPNQMYQNFVPQNMRQQSNVSMANAPRSPGFQRPMTNGVGPPGGRPPANVQPGPSSAGMPSPRITPQTHHPHPSMPQHQMQQQHPMQQAGGVPQGMPPNMQPMAYPPPYGYYYYPQPGAEYQMYQQPWMMPPPPQGGPQPAPVHPSNMPISPRQQPASLQQTPATPPANIPPALPSARLNTSASSFVPGQQNRVRITDSSGHEINFQRRTPSATASPSPPPAQLEKVRNRGAPIRIESEDERKKRVAEEEAKAKAKADAEAKVKRDKEEEEQAAKRKEEEEKERLRKEEEDRVRAAEEEKRKKAEEEERSRKEEEEKKRKAEEEAARRVEEERLQKEAEAERVKKEAEEAEKARKEKEEKEVLEKEAEKERIRKEAEEAARRKEEEARKKEEEERAKEEAAKSTVVPDVPASPGPDAPPADTVPPLTTFPESRKQRPIPGPLDLSSANRSGLPPPLPSALATARHIQDLGQIAYPEGVSSPRPDLNMNAKDGKFRYDRDFLLQFMKVCTEKPDHLPNLEAIGLEPVDQNAMSRPGPGRRNGGGSMGPPPNVRSASIGLGITPGGPGFSKNSGFAMGQFQAPGKMPSSSEDRFMRSTSMGAGPGGLQFPGRPSPMVRTSSQGNGMPGGMGSKRTRSKRGEARNESNRINNAGPSSLMNQGMSMESVAPLELSANRWVPMNNKKVIDENSPEVVDRKVRALLNKLTPENFDSISGQIITWANKSENEKDGRTLIQVIRLVFEKATDEAKFSEMYARLCRKMMEQISDKISDESLDKPIAGGQLFRKYLLNRCQEDFERGWNATKAAAAAAAAKAGDDKAVKEANEKRAAKPGEEELYSDEYYVAQKAKRQGLGLVHLIGELYKLQMLTEKIMHGCIKKFLKDIDNPEEEDIESLCTLLTIVGQSLDKAKANFHMNVYFERMGEIAKKEDLPFRMKAMLMDVIELRHRNWVRRNTSQAAPKTIAQVHEEAARERQQKEQESMNRSMAMSRGGSRRGVDRSEMAQVGPDGWAVAGGSGPSRIATKAGDLSNFGKISKVGPGPMAFGPSSVFNKKDATGKRDSGSLSRTNSSSNMFSMLSQNPEIAAEVAQPPSSRASRAPSRTTSVDISASVVADVVGSRPKLNLLPRSKLLDDASGSQQPSATPSEVNSEDEGEKPAASSMSSEKADEQIEKDVKEFFDARNINEGESYFTSLPAEYHHRFVDKIVGHAIESKESDSQLVKDLLARAAEKSLCSASALEEGLIPTAEAVEDIAIDAPKAYDLFALMIKGAGLDAERRTRIAGKTEDSERLLGLLG